MSALDESRWLHTIKENTCMQSFVSQQNWSAVQTPVILKQLIEFSSESPEMTKPEDGSRSPALHL